MTVVEMPRTASYQFVRDWDIDGDFGDSTEDVTAYTLVSPGVRITHGRDQARSLAPPMVPAETGELNNQGQEFSAEFPGSPIYGLLLPGRAVEDRATFGTDVPYESDNLYDEDLTPYNGTLPAVTLFTGVIDDIVQHPNPNERRVGISCLGSIVKLRGVRVTTILYENITTGTALGHLLDAAGWPADKRSVSTGDTTLLYWYLSDADAFDAAVALFKTEGAGAALYEDGDGVLHFENRNYRATTLRSLTSQATYYDQSEGQEIGYESTAAYDSDVFYNGTGGLHHIVPMSYAPGFRDIINVCRVKVVTRSVAALAVVWTYGATITLGASEAITLTAVPQNFFKAAVCTNGTDVTASSGTIASVSLSRTSGGRTDITITADGGGVTINLLQLRAQAITTSSEATITSTVDSSDSVSTFGTRTYTLDLLPDVTANQAFDLANAIVNRYMTQVPVVNVTLANVDGAHLLEILTRAVSDRITVIERHTGLNTDLWVEQVSHDIQEGGRRHLLTLGCEKAGAGAGSVFVWDDPGSLWDTVTWGT